MDSVKVRRRLKGSDEALQGSLGNPGTVDDRCTMVCGKRAADREHRQSGGGAYCSKEEAVVSSTMKNFQVKWGLRKRTAVWIRLRCEEGIRRAMRLYKAASAVWYS